MNRDDVTISKENFECCVFIHISIFQDSSFERLGMNECVVGNFTRTRKLKIGIFNGKLDAFFIWKLKLERDWNLKIENAGDWKSRSMEILKWKISGKKLEDTCIEFRCYSLAGFLEKHLSSKFGNSLLMNTLNIKIPSLAFSKAK